MGLCGEMLESSKGDIPIPDRRLDNLGKLRLPRFARSYDSLLEQPSVCAAPRSLRVAGVRCPCSKLGCLSEAASPPWVGKRQPLVLRSRMKTKPDPLPESTSLTELVAALARMAKQQMRFLRAAIPKDKMPVDAEDQRCCINNVSQQYGRSGHQNPPSYPRQAGTDGTKTKFVESGTHHQTSSAMNTDGSHRPKPTS